jgi:peptidoglycan/LPS O-acetylase OafA/YrhL
MLCVVAAIRDEWVSSPWMKLFGYPAVALWSASLVLWLANLSALPRPLHALARLGPSTYCAYFVKLPLCFLILQIFPQTKHLPFPIAALACVVATWLLAWVWHTSIEGPLVRLGYRLLGDRIAS